MKPDTPPTALQHFLTDELYLLSADKELYRNPQPETVTVEAEANEVTPINVIQTPAVSFKYLGGNQKHLLVLCHYPTSENITEEHLKPLTSTLSRLQFDLDDVAIVNLAQYPDTNWMQLQEFFKVQKLLVLGQQALPAAIPALQLNQVQHLGDTKALYTYSFDQMIGQKENTKTFWNQIQTL